MVWDLDAEPPSMSTSLFEVSMKMLSPCPTSMKWIVTLVPVWE